MKKFYFAHQRAAGTIRIPQGIIDGMKLSPGTGYVLTANPDTDTIFLEIIRPTPNQRNRIPETRNQEGEPNHE